jgi:hypothetical protein
MDVTHRQSTPSVLRPIPPTGGGERGGRRTGGGSGRGGPAIGAGLKGVVTMVHTGAKGLIINLYRLYCNVEA